MKRQRPWEIGHANGKKAIDTIFVITASGIGGFEYGNEYLGIYRHIDLTDKDELAAWRPGDTSHGILIERLK